MWCAVVRTGLTPGVIKTEVLTILFPHGYIMAPALIVVPIFQKGGKKQRIVFIPGGGKNVRNLYLVSTYISLVRTV